MPKRQPGRRKRVGKNSSERRAKKDAREFAKSVAGFLPVIGTVLDIESVYKSGKKLMNSGPKALKSMGKKRARRIGKKITKRFNLW
jgi:hypothetical protein